MERRNQCLQGVLRYAIQNTELDHGARLDSSKCEELDMEKKQFLENVIKSMTVDVVEELGKAIHCLESETASIESRIEALHVIRDYAENMDFANNFINIGGSRVVLDCLKCNDPKLIVCASYTIATLSQNNPFCQKHFKDELVIPMLIIHAKQGGDVGSSALHAISSLVRNFEEGRTQFIERDGLECVVECLQSEQSNMFIKSCFLLRALASECTAIRDKFVDLGAVAKLANLIDPITGFDVKIEILLSALYVLTQSDKGKQQFQSTNISEVLETIINTNHGKAECEEILKDSEALLAYLKEKK